ncbi:MAG: type II secretion system F family protein [Clostridiales bacterium]|nr:type II secretion system F family protein [Clostridiales bacterium]
MPVGVEAVKFLNKIPIRYIVIFCRQMAIVIDSGIPLVQGLYGLYGETTHRGLKKIIEGVHKDIQQGDSLSQSFEKYGDILPPMFCAIVYAGQASGSLAQSFKYMADFYENEHKLKNKLINMLIYPIFISILTIALLQFSISYITPYFLDIYSQNDEILPRATRILLNLNRVFGGFKLLYFILILLILVLVINRLSNYKLHSLILRFPILGGFLTKVIITRICTIISMALKSNVSLLDGISMARNTINNRMVQLELANIESRIIDGEDIIGAFKSSKLFTSIFLQLLTAGSISGDIKSVFDIMIGFYDAELEWTTSRFLYLMEPVLILLIGLIVGFVSYALIIPIYKMVDIM